MIRSKVVMFTTHVDAHGERLDLATLDDFVEQIKNTYLPLWTDHDPRIPPHGRVVDAYVEPERDGEFALIGIVESFESGERPPFDQSREMKVAELPVDFLINFDRSYRDRTSQALLNDLAVILQAPLRAESKKALEPLSILTFVAKAAFGGIAAGFAKRIGEAIFDRTKAKLALLLSRRRAKSDDFVFRYRVEIVVDGRVVEVEFLATAPSETQLERIFKHHLAVADSRLLTYLPAHPEVRRVVFNASGPDLEFMYAIRADVVPMFEDPRTGA